MKKYITFFMQIFIILLIFFNQVSAVPLPVFGRIENNTGEPIKGAMVLVSSIYGNRSTISGDDGYWQVDVGDPLNWPLNITISILASLVVNEKVYQASKNITLSERSVDVGTISLKLLRINETQFDNQNPIAQIKNHGFFEQPVGTILYFDAQESYDPDGIITGYRWDFNGDGDFDTGWSDEGLTTHVFNKEGIYKTILEVVDEGNNTDSAQAIVDISHDPRVLEIKAPTTLLSSETETFSFQTFTPLNISNISWIVQDTILSYEPTMTFRFFSPGYHVIILYVNDDSGNRYHDAVQIKVELDTDRDFIADSIETVINSSLWNPNPFTTVQLDMHVHYLVDVDNDKVYDVFYNATQKNYSTVSFLNESLLIDDDLDGYYDFTYDNGVLNRYLDPTIKKGTEEETPGFSVFIIIFSCLFMIVFYYKKKQ